jgi:glycosyltransferase involved in cell wall biosynthesis
MMEAAKGSTLGKSEPRSMAAELDRAGLPRLPGPKVVLLQTQAEAAGAQEVSRLLGDGFAARGFDVHHAFLYRRTGAFDEQPRTFYCAERRPEGLADNARMFTALVRYLRNLKPDAVLSFQHYGNLIGGLAARLAGIGVVIANPTSTAANLPRLVRWSDRLFGNAGVYSKIVINSQTTRDSYQSYPRRYRGRLMLIEHGFQTKTTKLTKAEARKLFGLPAESPVLACVARLHPMKNLSAAIRLLPREPHWHLALAGQGDDRDALLRTAAEQEVLDRLHLMGEVAPEEIGAFLKASDVFVFPSLAETFGLAPIEAAEAGIPVVANDLPVLREVLSLDGKPCALFVDTQDTAAFAACVRTLLTDAALRSRLIERGRGLSRRFSVETMVKSYADMLKALLSDRHPSSTSNT